MKNNVLNGGKIPWSLDLQKKIKRQISGTWPKSRSWPKYYQLSTGPSPITTKKLWKSIHNFWDILLTGRWTDKQGWQHNQSVVEVINYRRLIPTLLVKVLHGFICCSYLVNFISTLNLRDVYWNHNIMVIIHIRLAITCNRLNQSSKWWKNYTSLSR